MAGPNPERQRRAAAVPANEPEPGSVINRQPRGHDDMSAADDSVDDLRDRILHHQASRQHIDVTARRLHLRAGASRRPASISWSRMRP